MTRSEQIQALALPADLAARITACGTLDHTEAFSTAMAAVMSGWAGVELASLATAIDAHLPARHEILCQVGSYGYRPVPPEATAELVRLGVVSPGEEFNPSTKLGRELQDALLRVWILRRSMDCAFDSAAEAERTDPAVLIGRSVTINVAKSTPEWIPDNVEGVDPPGDAADPSTR